MGRRAELDDTTRSDRSGVDGREVLHPPAVPAVPGYELGDLLARGATSEVWAGADVEAGRRVVLKVVHTELHAVEAAAREASVSARAASAHIVRVEACVPLPDGRVALVMPHLRGGALDGLVRARGHLSPGEVVTVLAPVASAIGRLHDLGVVHGDVSPGNVLLEPDGRPVLGDLGLSHVVGDISPGVWGTDGYVAPEVVLGADPTPAADVYGVGALGWLCLTGQVPGPPGLRERLADLSRAGAGATPLVDVLEAAVSPRPEHRPTAHELAWQLFRAADPVALDLVRDDDPVSAVTYRLRAAAGSDAEPERPPRRSVLLASLHPRVRRLGRCTWRSTLPPGHPAGPRATRASPDRHQPPRWAVPPRPGRYAARHGGYGRGSTPTAVAAGSALTALMLLVGLVLGVAGLGAVERSTDARGVSGSVASRDGPHPRTPTVATTPFDLRMDPRAPQQQPAELLERLAEYRAAAWRDGTAAHLHGSDAPRSPTAVKGAAAVAEMARAGVRYTGLRYSVREAEVVTARDREALLRARIDTSAYEVAGPSGSTSRPAVRGEEVLVALVRTELGWRVSNVRRAP